MSTNRTKSVLMTVCAALCSFMTIMNANSFNASDNPNFLLCTADAGDLSSNPSPTVFTSCLGTDFTDSNGVSVAFTADYTELDETNPGSVGFSYLYLLANSLGGLVDISTSGNFDFSTLSNAGVYQVFGFSYDNNNPNSAADYLNTIAGDADLDDISQIEGDELAAVLCLDLDGQDATGNAVTVTVISGPHIASSASTSPITCEGTEGSISFILQDTKTSATDYEVTYEYDNLAMTATLTSLESVPLSGVYDSLFLGNLSAGVYDAFTFAIASEGCAQSALTNFTLSDPPAPTPLLLTSSDPTSCGGNDGSITLEGLTSGLSYTISLLRNTQNVSLGPLTADINGQLVLQNLIAADYNAIAAIETTTMCEGGNINTTLNEPSAAPLNTINPIMVCASDATNYDLSQHQSNLTTEAGTFAWYDDDPAASGILINDVSAVNFNSDTSFYVVFTETLSSCSATSTVNFSLSEEVQITLNSTSCQSDILTYEIDFSVSTNTQDTVQATGDNGFDYTSYLQSSDAINYILTNVPNGVTVQLTVKRENADCPPAILNIPAFNCCEADAGIIAPTAAQEICEGENSPEFIANYNSNAVNNPNPINPSLVISEIRISQTSGTGIQDYFEISGASGTDLNNLSYLVIGNDNNGENGIVEQVISLSGNIPASGFFTVANPDFSLGNADIQTTFDFTSDNNKTHLLVENFTGTINADLDTDNDGVLDLNPWSSVVYDLAILQNSTGGDLTYSTNSISPIGTNPTVHIYFDTANNQYQVGVADYTANTANDTPGLRNTTPAYTYLWLLSQDQTASGGAVNALVSTQAGANNNTANHIFENLSIGDYCVYGASFYGTAADFTVLNYTSIQALADSINAGVVCADIDVNACTPLSVIENMEVSNLTDGNCTSLDASGTYEVTFTISGGLQPISINGEAVTASNFSQGTITGTGTDGDPYIFTSNPIASLATYNYTISDASANCNSDTVYTGSKDCDPCTGYAAPDAMTDQINCADTQITLTPTGGGKFGVTPVGCHFYDANPTAGNMTPIASGTSLNITESIVPANGQAKTIYITSFSDIPDCESSAISLDITRNALPTAINATLMECAESDGNADFILQNADDLVDTNGGNTVSYHANNSDATAGINALPEPYNASNNTVVFARIENANSCTSIVEVDLKTLNCDVSIADPCSCRPNPANPSTSGNATSNDDGQFNETVSVTAPSGQTWFIQSVVGLFDEASAQPPLAPTAFVTGAAGEILVENDNGDGTSSYELNGLHIDAQGYAITVTNGSDVLSINNQCFYPTLAMLSAPNTACLFTDPFVITGEEVNGGLADVATFTVRDNNNAIVQTATGLQITIDPQILGTGTYSVDFEFDAGTPGQGDLTDPGCTQVISQTFTIQDTPSGIACNDNVQISVGDNCTSFIDPDLILEGNVGCIDDYETRIINNFNQNLGDTTTPDMLGNTYFVRVYHLPTNNYCTGSITVEDKQVPEFNCPIAINTINCWEDFNQVPAPIATDNCTAAPTVQQTGESINDSNPCVPVTVTRTYIAIDDSGNQSVECQQVIQLQSPALPDFPEDISFTCEQYAAFPNITNADFLNPAITDSDVTDADIDVALSTSNSILQNTGAGLPDIVQGTYCQYGVTSNDDTLALCGAGNTFKIIRTFTVLNWCLNNVVTTDINGDDNIQIVKVVDVTPPTLVRAPYQVSVNIMGSHPNPCLSTEFLLPATVTDNCNETQNIRIFTPVGEAIYLNGFDGTNGGHIPAPGLPLGFHDVQYVAVDACGNSNTITVQIEVIDDSTPTPVCDLITTVVLGTNGLATVNATVFDDGSNDDCGIDDFTVRRLTNPCNITGNTNFNETVTFCCADVNEDFVLVQLQVTDYFGNANTCEVQVIVEENTAPAQVFCPSAQTITCDFYSNNLEIPLSSNDQSVLASFGTASFADACGVTMSETFTDNVNNCGIGTIVRTFSAVDDFGNAGSACTQTIQVDHVSDFVVEFPQDLDYVCQAGEDPTANGDFGEPIIFFDNCEMVGVSVDDMTFNVVDDACFKIFRTWTVINWCVYDDFSEDTVVEDPEIVLPGLSLDTDGDKDDRTFRDGLNLANFPNAMPDGYIRYVQTIKVIDNTAPILNNPGLTEYCITENTCSTTVNLPTPSAMDCSPEIDYTATSSLGTGFGPFTGVTPGIYTITYSASDNCGNSSTIAFDIEVIDCKAPTPYCNGGLVIELSPIDTDGDTEPDAGEVEIWASDFDAGSFDNCSAVQFSFASDMSVTNLTYNCDSIGTRAVFLWVTDAAGNQDVCQTYVQIESVDNVCEEIAPLIAGFIEREDGEGVAEVEVMVSGNEQNMDMSNDEGYFEVESLDMGYDYSVIPSKNNEHALGVTTLDLVFIRRHVLTEQLLDSPFKIIAADANNNQTVSTADIVLIKQLILNNIQEFPSNNSWRFVDKYFNFADPANPFLEPFPEFRSYNNLESPVFAADFTAVKIGDVNNSAVVNFNGNEGEDRNANSISIFSNDRKVKQGETFSLTVKNEADLEILGMQGTVDYDTDALEFIQIEEGNILKNTDFGLSLRSLGALPFSYIDVTGTKLAKENVLFEITFTARKDGYLSEWLNISSRHLQAEAYLDETTKADIILNFKGQNIIPAVSSVALSQNNPNPFRDWTEIEFYLPEQQKYSLSIFNAAGKEIYSENNNGIKGRNAIQLTDRQLTESGVFYYRLTTKTDILTKKMIKY